MAKNQTEIIIDNSEKWQGDYKRNNKKNGIKNLRCFPFCREPSHRDSGFCGQPVRVTIKRKVSEDKRKLYVWGEFMIVDHFESKSRVGTVITCEDIETKYAKSRSKPFNPWYEGTLDNGTCSRTGASIKFFIKNHKGGWLYKFISSKHASSQVHCMAIYVFAQLNESQFECIGFHMSPEFTVYCRNRPKTRDLMLASLANKKLMRTQTVPSKVDLPALDPEHGAVPNDIKCCKTSTVSDLLFKPQESNEKSEEFHGQDSLISTMSECYEDNCVEVFPSNDPVDLVFMRVLDQFMTVIKSKQSVVPGLPRKMENDESETEREICYDIVGDIASNEGTVQSEPFTRKGTKRYNFEDNASNLRRSAMFDFGKIPDILPPLPINVLNENDSYLYADFEVPADVSLLFASLDADDNKEEALKVRKELWRICIMCTVLDSHWRTYKELYGQYSSQEQEIEYYDTDTLTEMEKKTRAAFIKVALIFGSIRYQNDLDEALNRCTSQHQKERCYVKTMWQYLEIAVTTVNVSLISFLNLFDVKPSYAVVESAKKRLRSINGFLGKFPRTSTGEASPGGGVLPQQQGMGAVTSSLRLRQMNEAGNFVHNITRTNEATFDVSGYWRMSNEVLQATDYIRATYLKTSWVMRKIYTYLETQMHIEDDGTVIRFKSGYRLMSAFSESFVPDGQKRRFAAGDHDAGKVIMTCYAKKSMPYNSNSYEVNVTCVLLRNPGIPVHRPAPLSYRLYWETDSLLFQTFFEVDQKKILFRRFSPSPGGDKNIMMCEVGYSELLENTIDEWKVIESFSGVLTRQHGWSMW